MQKKETPDGVPFFWREYALFDVQFKGFVLNADDVHAFCARVDFLFATEASCSADYVAEAIEYGDGLALGVSNSDVAVVVDECRNGTCVNVACRDCCNSTRGAGACFCNILLARAHWTYISAGRRTCGRRRSRGLC